MTCKRPVNGVIEKNPSITPFAILYLTLTNLCGLFAALLRRLLLAWAVAPARRVTTSSHCGKNPRKSSWVLGGMVY